MRPARGARAGWRGRARGRSCGPRRPRGRLRREEPRPVGVDTAAGARDHDHLAVESVHEALRAAILYEGRARSIGRIRVDLSRSSASSRVACQGGVVMITSRHPPGMLARGIRCFPAILTRGGRLMPTHNGSTMDKIGHAKAALEAGVLTSYGPAKSSTAADPKLPISWGPMMRK